MSMGAAVAAAAKRAERRLVEHLRDAGALTESSAVAITDQRWMDKRVLARLIAAGAVRETRRGLYLDEGVYSTYRSRRTRTMGLILVPLIIASILVIWWATTQ